MEGTRGWAFEEFGHAQLGDARRSQRLVQLAAEVAKQPAGTVTGACRSSASREGAFRWLESPAVHPEAVVAAAAKAGARRCQGHGQIVVPVDATSLTLTDMTERKGLGAVGSWAQGGRGVHVMTALAVATDGTPLGVCGQQYWVRQQRSTCSHRRKRRATDRSESRFWVDVLDSARTNLAREAPSSTPWFQLDRGADCWEVFELARQAQMLITVRATHDRRLDRDAAYLWQTVERSRVRVCLQIHVPARPPKKMRQRTGGRMTRHWMSAARPARVARLQVRAATVPLRLTTPTGRKLAVEFNAVLVREQTSGPDPIEWMLLTTHRIDRRADLLKVVRSYSLRWRVEDFHRTWKRGLCRVEDTQLRSRDAVFKWATILASVATRAMRLSHLARTSPNVPATDELSDYELEALLALREPKAVPKGAGLTLGQAVRWLADIGGYIGPWNGPPGPTVIGRGLHDVLIAARAFESRDKKR
jgi:hypothetical protein